MLEITRKNCYKCDLETIIDNNSQYFWINLRYFEAETESKWFNIFNKHDNKSTLKYRRELRTNIKFQSDRIFVRNDLFEKIIKSCIATNVEFLMLKEKLGICLYEENYYEEEIIKIQDDIEEIDKASNEKSTEKLTKELIEESDNESDNESGNESDNESNKESVNKSNKKSIEGMFEELSKESKEEFFKNLMKIKNLNNNKITTDWYDKNKLYNY